MGSCIRLWLCVLNYEPLTRHLWSARPASLLPAMKLVPCVCACINLLLPRHVTGAAVTWPLLFFVAFLLFSRVRAADASPPSSSFPVHRSLPKDACSCNCGYGFLFRQLGARLALTGRRKACFSLFSLFFLPFLASATPAALGNWRAMCKT